MNRLKLTLVIVGGLAALVLLMVILAFTPSVQTWAVRRALTGQPGLTMMVGSVAAGLTSAEIRDVRVEQDGVIIVAQQVSATYSAMDYLSGSRITIENVAVKGLEIDARKPSAKQSTAPAQVALAPSAFHGEKARVVKFRRIETRADEPSDDCARARQHG